MTAVRRRSDGHDRPRIGLLCLLFHGIVAGRDRSTRPAEWLLRRRCRIPLLQC